MSIITPKFKGRVDGDKLIIEDEQRYREYIEANLQGPVEVTVQKPVKTRSLKQNSYGYGVALKLLSNHTGYSVREIKEVVKKDLGFVRYIKRKNGSLMEVTRSSARFSTVEWEVYMKRIRQWGDEEGIFINEPI